MTSKALIRLISKSMTGNDIFLNSFLLILVGVLLLLLDSLMSICGLPISKSWLLLILGGLLGSSTCLSISCSSCVSRADGEVEEFMELDLLGKEEDAEFCEEGGIEDLFGGEREERKAFPRLERLMKWWSETIRSSM